MPKTASSTVIWRTCLPSALCTASFMLARPPVPGAAHTEQHVLVAGDGALHHQDVAGRIRLDHSEVLHGYLPGPHVAARLEDLAAHLLPDLPLTDVVHAELSQVLELAKSFQVALLGRVDPLARAEAQLDGGIAVALA